MKEQESSLRCVIIGGAKIRDYESVRSALRDDDYLVYCDGGLKHLDGIGRRPSLIVGDFDSHENPQMDIETIVLPCEKDDTDTMFAVKEGLRRGFKDFLLAGVIGERLDHTLGNVFILEMLFGKGARAVIIDDYSEMQLVGSEPVTIEDRYAYFSLINMIGEASGINIEGAKYPLENAEITSEYQYGISNEVLPGQCAVVSAAKGRLLLIKVR